jgi:hypothetical protein
MIFVLDLLQSPVPLSVVLDGCETKAGSSRGILSLYAFTEIIASCTNPKGQVPLRMDDTNLRGNGSRAYVNSVLAREWHLSN